MERNKAAYDGRKCTYLAAAASALGSTIFGYYGQGPQATAKARCCRIVDGKSRDSRADYFHLRFLQGDAALGRNSAPAAKVIVSVNRKPVKTAGESEEELKKSGGQAALFIKRGNEGLLIVAQMAPSQ